MNYKKFLIGAILAIVMSMGITAYAEVTEISPDKNIGVYTKDQSVAFIVKRDDSSLDEEIGYTVENINGEIVRNGNTTILSGNTECTIKPGNFIPGWYRLRVYDATSDEIDIFASFTVVGEWEDDFPIGPFSSVHQGWHVIDVEKIPDYAEALRIVGFDTVRDGCQWYSGSDSNKNIFNARIAPLNNNGINPLMTYSVATSSIKDEDKGITGNLYSTYNMLKKLSADYDGKIGAYEIINEPCLKGRENNFSADIYSSYYKAAALAIESGSPDTHKSFGGLAVVAPDFSELMMQNGVPNYTDTFNVHLHNAASKSKNTIDFSGILPERLKVFSSIYGNNQPLWVTEAGLNAPIDENGVLDSEFLKYQARYTITSMVQSVGEYGTQKHFWFLTNHYLENGKNYGATSPEDCTYPVFYSLSMLTRYIGEGRPIGVLANASEGVSGYFFDAGEYDVAVLWNNNDGISYQQLKTDSEVIANNLIGGTEYLYGMTKNGLVNIPVASDPIIVRFKGTADSGNYRKKTFDTTFERDINRNVAEKVVFQADWGSPELEVSEGRYVLTPGEIYEIKLNVYNFNDIAVDGTISLVVDENLEIVGDSFKNFNVDSCEASEVSVMSFSVKLKEDAISCEKGYLSFEGTVGGYDMYPLVCGYMVDNYLTRADIGIVSGLFDFLSNPWANGNATSGIKRNISKTLLKSEYTFTASFNGGKRYWHPKVTTTVPSDSDGLVFDIDVKSIGTDTCLEAYLTTSKGSYRCILSEMELGTKTYVVPWDSFSTYTGDVPFVVDVSDISAFVIGFTTESDDEVKYTLSGIGTYNMADKIIEDEFGVVFTGITDDGVYYEGVNIALVIEGAFDNIYHNYEKYEAYSEESDKAIISISDFEPGAHNIIVTKNDNFGKVHYKELNFCIKERTDYGAGGVFY